MEDQTLHGELLRRITEFPNTAFNEDDDQDEIESNESMGETIFVLPHVSSQNSYESSDNEITWTLPNSLSQLLLQQPLHFRRQSTLPLPTASRSLDGPISAAGLLQHGSGRRPTFHRRRAVPSHYLLKIESFPSLSKAPIESYSSEFEAGGYKWELSIYPTGDKKNGGQDHISMFLRLLDTDSLPAGWEVNAIFTFFVFDRIRDEYVTVQDAITVLRFHSMKTNWGIPKFIDLETFNDRSNGYLVDGTCTFGAEVFVVKNTFKGERLSAIDEPVTCTYTWKINSFSSMTSEYYLSDEFVGGDYKWWIWILPNGSGEGKGKSLSLHLLLASTLPPDTELLVTCVLRVRHQISGKHFERKASKKISNRYIGFHQFMSLSKFKHPENGYLLGDTCIIEAQFEVVGLIKRD